MDTYLFVVRSTRDKEIYAAELPAEFGPLRMARTLMEVVRNDYPREPIDYCEIWERTSHGTMTLIHTAF